jgi:hypothetical protein
VERGSSRTNAGHKLNKIIGHGTSLLDDMYHTTQGSRAWKAACENQKISMPSFRSVAVLPSSQVWARM